MEKFTKLMNAPRTWFDGVLDPEKSNPSSGLFVLFIVSSASFVFIVALSIIIYVFNGIDYFGKMGSIGDFIGGTLNPALTFLTFMGLLITIALQQSELRESRVELRRSADALEAQIKASAQQASEATFFEMLSLHNSIISGLDVKSHKGRDCFKLYYNRYKSVYCNKFDKFNNEKEKIIHVNNELWPEFQQDLGHYYRYLYNMIRFIDEQKFDNKATYIRLIRAQFSDYELLLLFYNCLTPQGKKFLIYIEKFALFDNIPDVLLISPDHRSLYSEESYGGLDI